MTGKLSITQWHRCPGYRDCGLSLPAKRKTLSKYNTKQTVQFAIVCLRVFSVSNSGLSDLKQHSAEDYKIWAVPGKRRQSGIILTDQLFCQYLWSDVWILTVTDATPFHPYRLFIFFTFVLREAETFEICAQQLRKLMQEMKCLILKISQQTTPRHWVVSPGHGASVKLSPVFLPWRWQPYTQATLSVAAVKAVMLVVWCQYDYK